eukprot:2956605-Lingulodinium_polyedra.AAC.1
MTGGHNVTRTLLKPSEVCAPLRKGRENVRDELLLVEADERVHVGRKEREAVACDPPARGQRLPTDLRERADDRCDGALIHKPASHGQMPRRCAGALEARVQ